MCWNSSLHVFKKFFLRIKKIRKRPPFMKNTQTYFDNTWHLIKVSIWIINLIHDYSKIKAWDALRSGSRNYFWLKSRKKLWKTRNCTVLRDRRWISYKRMNLFWWNLVCVFGSIYGPYSKHFRYLQMSRKRMIYKDKPYSYLFLFA